MRFPTFSHERLLSSQGHFVIGVDEAGCGCLAGPVVAAAVHLPLDSRIGSLTDSKLLSAAAREEIFAQFIKMGLRFSVSCASAREIDRLNIRKATLLAMKRAVLTFNKATFALVDAWTIPDISIPQKGIIHGDRLIKSIAAASVIAKVARDRLMEDYEKKFPGYGFSRHKGYGTKQHFHAIRKLGPTPLHRRSFLKKAEIEA